MNGLHLNLRNLNGVRFETTCNLKNLGFNVLQYKQDIYIGKGIELKDVN